MKRTLIALAAVPLFAFAAVPAYANFNASPNFGSPSAGAIPDKIIRIGTSTKYANVAPFQTVRFVARGADGNESSFEWRFNTFGPQIIPLADIAPRDYIGNRSVRIYVSRPPSND